MGGISAGAAILGNGHAGTRIAVGHVMTGAAGIDMAAVHHFTDAVRQRDAVELPRVSVDTIPFTEVTLEETPTPLITEPGIYLLEVERSAFERGVDRVDDADAWILDRQPAQVAGHIDRVIAGIAGPFALLGTDREPVAEPCRDRNAEQETQDNQAAPFTHCVYPLQLAT